MFNPSLRRIKVASKADGSGGERGKSEKANVPHTTRAISLIFVVVKSQGATATEFQFEIGEEASRNDFKPFDGQCVGMIVVTFGGNIGQNTLDSNLSLRVLQL